MSLDQLKRTVQHARCRVIGWQDASNHAHRSVLASLIRELKSESSTVLCEPSLARSTTRPPDIVVVCPRAGIHVIEVKGVSLDQIAAIEPGGQFAIRYATGTRRKNPFVQVRNAMFDIRDAAQRAYFGDLEIPIRYWVVLAQITRVAWQDRWGRNAVLPRELLFQEDVAGLANRLSEAGRKQLQACDLEQWNVTELQAVYSGFGDSSVLFPAPEDRAPRQVRETTLGELFDEAAETYKTLSDEQQKLSAQIWERGPRLIRGVAGSGKTVVLANNLARWIERGQKSSLSLFDEPVRPPRILAVCFNRTLVPFLQKKIGVAYRQRTGRELPKGAVDVFAYNRLMWHLAQAGLWGYQRIADLTDEERAARYTRDLKYVKEHEPQTFERYAYDAIYVDEGQDFAEEDFRLLSELCVQREGEPSLFVFYDDAQNLYGRKRPNWQSLGLNVVGGRSHVMTECFRNTRQIVDTAFNVLYGSFAPHTANIPTKAFGDVATLVEKELLEQVDQVWRVKFARREGMPPRVTVAGGTREENELVVSRLRWLIEDQEVRPQDILVLSYYRERVRRLAEWVRRASIQGVEDIHLAFDDRDTHLGQRGRLTFSTVASAKGYDAYCVLLASANQFPTDVLGRANFYVGCTRAIEYLEITGTAPHGLLHEAQKASRFQEQGRDANAAVASPAANEILGAAPA
ncbi:nuclease-related domain-containing DEAD/DEAH box helicase [Candidatus Laterigemmans baculatus]|uniref:nuclease-related domain-containing DEAD/DEAH box helicase n=1 Tax=Candidatus Laterigemmans baculatus TaxID=2770505 RepID=UPI0013DAB22F|nr:nuclease-related domain-containing DEAD/DEAH box helicase [Candidatus Laterigemmans baculatus]